jgi:molybdopterin/thiamine biosynthesis adenylyltransferase
MGEVGPAPAAPPKRPRIKATVEVLPVADGRLFLIPGGTEEQFVVDGQEGASLLSRLDGTVTIEELCRDDGQGLADAVTELHALGLLEDAADDDRLEPSQLERYDRQLRYFADLAPAGARRSEYQRRLSEAHVVVIGLGGLGAWAVYGLACAGVGRITGVDGDVVELSNLNRQILYRERDLGRPKATAAARAVRAFNAEIEFEPVEDVLESEDEVAEVVAGADLVVDAADWPPHEIERWINSACFAAGVSFLTMSQHPPQVRVGPLYVPGETGCFACLERSLSERFPLYQELTAPARRPAQSATFGPACGLIGSAVALEAVHYLTGLRRPSTLGGSFVLDLRTFEMERRSAPRYRDCPICA